MFPKARTSILAAYKAGVKIAVGTDAPAIPHGRNADEFVTLVDWGLPPLAVLRAATVTAAELINVTDRGRLAQGQLADIIAVPGNPLEDITVTQKVSFVMKGGKVYVEFNQPTRTDDLVEIQQLLARYAVTITQEDIDGLIGVFTPDGTYSAFGETYSLDRFPELVAAAPKGLFLTGTAVGRTSTAIRQAALNRCASSTTPPTTCGSVTTATLTPAPPTGGG